jgi:hypothetical protein
MNTFILCLVVQRSIAQLWTYCAGEGYSCQFIGTQIVRFGAGTRWINGSFAPASVACAIASFGSDPASGVVKSCYIASPLINNVEWNAIQSLLIGCNSTLCASLQTSNQCSPPLVCNNVGNIIQLNLASTGLTGSLTSAIALLSQIQSISLSNNALNSTIPPELAFISKLTYLYILTVCLSVCLSSLTPLV